MQVARSEALAATKRSGKIRGVWHFAPERGII